MFLILAALQQELGIAMDLCRQVSKVRLPGVSAWEACHGPRTFRFLKTGVGPARAEKQFRALLSGYRPAGVLLIGYAGALDPSLALGDIVAVRRATLLSGGKGLPIGEIPVCGSWPLADADSLASAAAAVGLRAFSGDTVTSAHIVGEPVQKQALFAAHGAAVVDMETAVIAQAAAPLGIPVSCVRAISDEAGDEFLAPFTYAPEQGVVDRTVRVLRAGNWGGRYRDWREKSAVARESLRKFLARWFEGAAATASPRSV